LLRVDFFSFCFYFVCFFQNRPRINFFFIMFLFFLLVLVFKFMRISKKWKQKHEETKRKSNDNNKLMTLFLSLVFLWSRCLFSFFDFPFVWNEKESVSSFWFFSSFFLKLEGEGEENGVWVLSKRNIKESLRHLKNETQCDLSNFLFYSVSLLKLKREAVARKKKEWNDKKESHSKKERSCARLLNLFVFWMTNEKTKHLSWNEKFLQSLPLFQ